MNDSSKSEIAKKNNRKRFNKTATIYAASLGVGLLGGAAITLHQNETIHLSTNILFIGAALFTICLYALTWAWYKSMDEFEQASLNQAGNLAFHTGFLALPWFLLNELGIFPPLDAIVLLFVMSMVFIIYYYGKKFL